MPGDKLTLTLPSGSTRMDDEPTTGHAPTRPADPVAPLPAPASDPYSDEAPPRPAGFGPRKDEWVIEVFRGDQSAGLVVSPNIYGAGRKDARPFPSEASATDFADRHWSGWSPKIVPYAAPAVALDLREPEALRSASPSSCSCGCSSLDPEVAAMAAVVSALKGLTMLQTSRVLRWANDRFPDDPGDGEACDDI